MKRILTGGLLFLGIAFAACKPEEEPLKGPALSEIERSILRVNQYILKRNLDHIRGFVKRSGWDMKQTGSGLFYEISREGRGGNAEKGDRVIIAYELLLIDGTPVSSSRNEGPLNFIVGQGGVTSGLEEAVLLMKEGSNARLILPPHLAYGNFGDAELGIPPDAIVIYRLQLISIQ